MSGIIGQRPSGKVNGVGVGVIKLYPIGIQVVLIRQARFVICHKLRNNNLSWGEVCQSQRQKERRRESGEFHSYRNTYDKTVTVDAAIQKLPSDAAQSQVK